jgi:hypothetical protein
MHHSIEQQPSYRAFTKYSHLTPINLIKKDEVPVTPAFCRSIALTLFQIALLIL